MSPSITLINAVNGNGHVIKKQPPHGFGTRAIHVGSDPNEDTGAVIPPISLSTTYKQSSIGVHKVCISPYVVFEPETWRFFWASISVFRGAQLEIAMSICMASWSHRTTSLAPIFISHMHLKPDFFSFAIQGFEYSRSGNPNRNALESTLASLESGGAHGLAFASGSATTSTVLQSLGPGAHIVSVNDVYGGTFRYMTRVAAENQGLETTFLDLENSDDDTILSSLRSNTKVSSS
jgi:cystathionine beta-lyase/cystathionine gamma-synthase